MPDHPRADMLGMVGDHILVMQKKLGRPTVKGDVIQHLDWNKLNNDASNLELCTRQQHQQVPEFQARFLKEKGLLEEFRVWWLEHRDDTFEQEELEQKIVLAEQKANRTRRRLERNVNATSNGTV